MKTLSTLVALCLSAGASAQLTVNNDLSPSELATLLEGLNVSIGNVQVNCAPGAMGHFSGESELAISEGLLLTTGNALDVTGPVGLMASTFNGYPGDADLDLFTSYPSYDACVLEFDCIPLGDTLLFNFSFGSEEYQEFVNSPFNDVFAIFLSGPGFPVPTNVAALPDGTPVAINNVNLGMNSTYYHDNEAGSGVHVSYDGFTTNLTAFAVVSPDDIYHFKVAIADVADGVLDSGVFLEAFSFRSVMGLSTAMRERDAAPMRIARDGDQAIVSLPASAIGQQLLLIGSNGAIVQRMQVNSDRMVVDLSGVGRGVYLLHLPGSPVTGAVRFALD
jgi:hypothetical protein